MGGGGNKKIKWKTVGYYLIIYRVSSTDQIYYLAAKRRGDKFDQSMTRGNLLDNNKTLFIFISILIMTKETQKTDDINRFSERRFSERKFSEPVATGWIERRWLSANIPRFVSVDLIGKKNQVKLELQINHEWRTMSHRTEFFIACNDSMWYKN